MGVVWRAWQEPPGREVALKVVRPEQLLFPESRVRFRREVELASRLQHPAILPVLALGEDRGLPWFATELIPGTSLGELLLRLRQRFDQPGSVDLAALPGMVAEAGGLAAVGEAWRNRAGKPHRDWTHCALEIGRELAEALAHAHSRGVLHRDIKAQNVLISVSGRVWLADFGLASAEGEASLTASQAAVGSLPFMAPEVLVGGAVDVRADVYSLGVLLYELLLLRRPFEGPHSQALVTAILAGEVPRPRALEPQLSADLEALLLTALARDPAQRYATAAALQADLEALLDGRPTMARPRGLLGRLGLLVRRRPAAALAAILGAVLVVGGPTTFGVQASRAASAVRTERDRTVEAQQARAKTAEEAADRIALERDRAVAAYQRAIQAVESMLSKVSDDLAYLPAMEALREDLLEEAVELLSAIVAEGGLLAGERAPLELATAHARLAELYQQLGRGDQARQAYRDAQATAHQAQLSLEREFDGAAAVAALMQEIEYAAREARSEVAAGRFENGRVVAVQAQQLLSERGAQLPPDSAADFKARLQATLGLVEARSGDPDAGRKLLRAALLTIDPDPQGPLPPAERWTHAFEVWSDVGLLGLQLDGAVPNMDTVSALERALELAEQRLAADPNPSLARELVNARVSLAGVHLRREEFAEALELYQLAEQQGQALVVEHPAVITFQLELAGVHNQLGLLADYQDDLQTARTNYAAAEEVLRKLSGQVPDNPTILHRLALARLNLSAPLRHTGEVEGAQDLVAQAFEALRNALRISPEDNQLADTLITLYSARWLLCRDRGDHAGIAETARAMAAESLEPADQARLLHRSAFAATQAFVTAGADTDLTDDQRAAIQTTYAELAADLTKQSYQAGSRYTDLNKIENLKPLQGHPAFAALIEWFETETAPR
jgi:eukaryotic-like serine/threonine-protein kinase